MIDVRSYRVRGRELPGSGPEVFAALLSGTTDTSFSAG